MRNRFRELINEKKEGNMERGHGRKRSVILREIAHGT